MESQVSLELVLVLVGICVVIGIYFISTWGKKDRWSSADYRKSNRNRPSARNSPTIAGGMDDEPSGESIAPILAARTTHQTDTDGLKTYSKDPEEVSGDDPPLVEQTASETTATNAGEPSSMDLSERVDEGPEGSIDPDYDDVSRVDTGETRPVETAVPEVEQIPSGDEEVASEEQGDTEQSDTKQSDEATSKDTVDPSVSKPMNDRRPVKPSDVTDRSDRLDMTIDPISEDRSPSNENDEDGMSRFQYRPPQGFEKVSQIDYWVRIHGERDVGRETVLAIYREGASSFTRKSSIFGMRLPDRVWRDIEQESEDVRFAELVITIQLADRRGPISEAEMVRFSNLISNLSERTGRGFAFMASMESALEQAKAIHSFVRHFDSTFVLNILPKNEMVFEDTMIDRVARQIGLERSAENHYVRNKRVGKHKVCLYRLTNLDGSGQFDFDNLGTVSVDGVAFSIKPSHTRIPGAVFSEMMDAAKVFASRVKGEVTTPTHQGLSASAADEIRSSIEVVTQEMEKHGIKAGSEEAIRIF